MAYVRADIAAVVVASAPIPSLVILKPRREDGSGEALPIRVGTAEAMSIGMTEDARAHKRPMTHDLLFHTILTLGATVRRVAITEVQGATFFAQIELYNAQNEVLVMDARPSDAIALALRAKASLWVDQAVFDVAGYPDFDTAKREGQRDTLEEFDQFVENVNPADFKNGTN